ncbi:LppP/LprE family lipoprotein [Nocardia sp. NPDC050710]|uniref:LppP/LprE family lipoprotein n=1 Tax=Nocardia sp. NPDC050710 TaxID=3157220 RepID=UPI0034111C47
MHRKSSAWVAVAASVGIAAAGCDSEQSGAGGTSVPLALPPSSVIVSTPVGTPADRSEPAAAPNSAATPGPSTSPVRAAPNGSGHGLCFDLDSALAASAVARLGSPPAGTGWEIQEASNDPIDAGCSGVLSWMTVEGPGIHPGTHILFFTDGAYLGTATAQPYAYTEVLGKTRNTVSVQYRWPKPEDPLCCPQGGPSVVTFTLNGTSVQANGQFPPDN